MVLNWTMNPKTVAKVRRMHFGRCNSAIANPQPKIQFDNQHNAGHQDHSVLRSQVSERSGHQLQFLGSLRSHQQGRNECKEWNPPRSIQSHSNRKSQQSKKVDVLNSTPQQQVLCSPQHPQCRTAVDDAAASASNTQSRPQRKTKQNKNKNKYLQGELQPQSTVPTDNQSPQLNQAFNHLEKTTTIEAPIIAQNRI